MASRTRSSRVRSRRRPLCQVARPVVHQDTPPLEQVRARVGRLDLVPDHMRQGRLDHLAWMVRLLGRPVPETRTEPVRHGRNLVLPELAVQFLFEKRLPVAEVLSKLTDLVPHQRLVDSTFA